MQKHRELSGPRTIFFLHLLGLDTNGHGNKPHSHQYKDNLKCMFPFFSYNFLFFTVVDKGIKRIVELVEDIFPDQKSAYIFTADHGMTDWGSHGGGSDDEVCYILSCFVQSILKDYDAICSMGIWVGQRRTNASAVSSKQIVTIIRIIINYRSG